MKDAIREALNGSTLPSEVVEGIRQSFSADEGDVVRALQERFASQRVRWAHAKGEDSLVRYLYEATPLLREQFAKIKEALPPPATSASAQSAPGTASGVC